jgi:hypothetical protein
MKLTDAQRRVLARMAAGETLHHGQTGFKWWLSAPPTFVSKVTALRLLENGLIERVSVRRLVCEYYGLTDAGRAALKE